MSSVPERIWAKLVPHTDGPSGYGLVVDHQPFKGATEYVTLDVAQEMVAAAYEAAAQYASDYAQGFADPWVVKHFGLVSGDIRALTPADARVALDRRDRQMRVEGMREAVKIAWDSAQNMVAGNLHDRGRQTAFVELSIAVSDLADKTEKDGA